MSKLRRTPKVFGSSYQPNSPRGSGGVRFSLTAWRPIIIVVVLVLGGILVTRLPIFQIKSVSLQGVNNPSTVADLQTLVGRSIFSGQIDRTVERWMIDDPSLERLSCRRGIPNTLQCQSTYRTGALVWKQADGEYWVDKTGQVFGLRTPEQTAPVIVEDALATAKVGASVASTEIIEVIIRIQRLLTERAIAANRFYVVDAIYQPGVVLSGFALADGRKIDREVRAVFAVTESVDAQVKTLHQLLINTADRGVTYVDLRVPGYVYYR